MQQEDFVLGAQDHGRNGTRLKCTIRSIAVFPQIVDWSTIFSTNPDPGLLFEYGLLFEHGLIFFQTNRLHHDSLRRHYVQLLSTHIRVVYQKKEKKEEVLVRGTVAVKVTSEGGSLDRLMPVRNFTKIKNTLVLQAQQVQELAAITPLLIQKSWHPLSCPLSRCQSRWCGAQQPQEASPSQQLSVC